MEKSSIETYLKKKTIPQLILNHIVDKNTPVIFDIGSCEGEDTIRYSKLYPNARLYTFEPLPANFNMVKSNLERFSVRNAQCFQLALSDAAGTADFYVSSGHPPNKTIEPGWNYGNKSSSLLTPKKHTEIHSFISFDETIPVKTERLDTLAAQYAIDRIDFIHMDVQGAELKVLEGAGSFLQNIKSIWLEVANVELYANQPLRNDIEKYLSDNEFVKVISKTSVIGGDQLYVNTRFFSTAQIRRIKLAHLLKSFLSS